MGCGGDGLTIAVPGWCAGGQTWMVMVAREVGYGSVRSTDCRAPALSTLHVQVTMSHWRSRHNGSTQGGQSVRWSAVF